MPRMCDKLPELPRRLHLTLEEAQECEMRFMAGFPVGDEESREAAFILQMRRSARLETEP